MQKTMYIGEYKVLWEQVGWSYAKVFIYKRSIKKLLWWSVSYDEFLWEDPNNKCLKHTQTMLPTEQTRWFNQAVKNYEEYKSEWDKYKWKVV